jgi:hypothetical protein
MYNSVWGGGEDLMLLASTSERLKVTWLMNLGSIGLIAWASYIWNQSAGYPGFCSADTKDWTGFDVRQKNLYVSPSTTARMER